MARKTDKPLSAEDRRLWKKVTETVTPKPGVRSEDLEDDSDELQIFLNAIQPETAPIKKAELKTSTASKAPKTKTAATPAIKSTLPPIVSLDRKAKSRLARGVTSIDGRIDLHGMTQDQARFALQTFIGRAYASGWKIVLVITGKGRSDFNRGPHSFDLERGAPGVLRRKVPEWLGDSSLRPFVVGYDKAAPAHGGEGALYVRLRRKRA